MGLIKASNTPASLSNFSMRDIEAQANALVLCAKQQADQILAKTQEEGALIRQRAYDQGFAAGKEDGLKKGTEEGRASGKQTALVEHRVKLEQLLKTLAAQVTDLDASRARLESQAASEVIKLAVAIARRVTKLQGALDPTVLTENVRQAARMVVSSCDVRIAVHPTQKQLIGEIMPQLKMQWPNVTHVQLLEDETVQPGGCRIMTSNGRIDADLETQVNRVAADLLPAVQEPQP